MIRSEPRPSRAGTWQSHVMRSRGLAPLLVLLAALCGCPPGTPSFVPPHSRAEALTSINDNLSRINQPLRANGTVSFRFKDANGKSHAVPAQDASLDFIPSAPAPPPAETPPTSNPGQPQTRSGDLLFSVRSLGGTVAQFGATAERYWLWVDLPDFKKLWWGDWARVQPGTESRLPIPPNELFDALLLRPLPPALEGGLQPLLRVADADYRLLFVRLGAAGQPIGWREVRLDTRNPFYPVEIIDRTAEGAIVMDAQISRYEPIGRGGPLTPRRYQVRWPLHDAEMKLDITRIRFLEEPPPPILFPSRWSFESESIDAPPPAPQGANQP